MSSSKSMPWSLVIAGCMGMFAATATGSSRSPFLPDMAADFAVSLPAVANLFGVTATSWGIASWLVGLVSDRIGRRVFLIGAPAMLAVAMFAAANAPGYWSFLATIAFAGVCCGAFTSTTLAEVSLGTASSHQGRALGYVMSGQSFTLLLGIPIAAWLGAWLGWRGVHLALGALAVLAAVNMIFALRSTPRANTRSGAGGHPHTTLGEAMTGPVVRLFVALAVERVSFGLATFYYASFLRTAYGLEIGAVALPLVGFALGNIVGTIAGGQVADRFAYRRVSFALALIMAGSVALPWFAWLPGVTITVGFGVLFAFFNAMSRPSLLAAMADVPAQVRGVVMGLNSSIASIGWLTAALVGGWFYAGIGFTSFGPLMFAMCIIGAAVVIPDSRIRQRMRI